MLTPDEMRAASRFFRFYRRRVLPIGRHDFADAKSFSVKRGERATMPPRIEPFSKCLSSLTARPDAAGTSW